MGGPGHEGLTCVGWKAYEDGHLLYKDIASNEHVYKYKYGKASARPPPRRQPAEYG